MIKKIIFAMLLCLVITSCGKKGDPIYKVSKKISIIQNIHLKTV